MRSVNYIIENNLISVCVQKNKKYDGANAGAVKRKCNSGKTKIQIKCSSCNSSMGYQNCYVFLNVFVESNKG